MSETLSSRRHDALIALLIRKRRGADLTQADLAKRLGQHQSFVARIESGQRRIDVVEFLQLAEAIGFDVKKAISQIRAVRS